ncbi:energy-coupling factor ABC transporter permease [Mycolicibacterium vaccae]|uniref:energy-coupling factor ABC transporter permease n=1 Tax=Mycolicibacterium vaccae TaxID=1810 RepID=UPI003D07C8DF
MHIEPGLVDGPKIVLSYLTAAGAGTVALTLASRLVKERGLATLLLRTMATTAAVLTFFQILPHYPVGVSEVHLILGSTLFLLFGAAPAALGLALGLLLQGMLFAPLDLPQYGMNVTTLLVPLLALQLVAGRVIPPRTRYVDLKYAQVLSLSATYQAGIVSWVAFWAFYGQGFALSTLGDVAYFGAAYLAVILLEPLVDLAVLAGAKGTRALKDSTLVDRRLLNPV